MQSIRLAGALLAISIPFSAQAAPQMLGLPQTAGATPLYCSGGDCTAELSAFCLQADRDPPRAGTVYTPVDPSRIILQLTRADGSVVTRPAGKLVRFASARGHFAVRVIIARATLARLGAVKAAIRVGTQVSLVPNPVTGDKRPLKAAEINSVSRELRADAAPLTDGDRPDAVAARVLNRVINLLPIGDDTDPRWRRGLWARAIKGAQLDRSSRAGLGRVRQWQRICRGFPLIPGAFRRCLERGHDGFIGQVNRDYWRITGAGS